MKQYYRSKGDRVIAGVCGGLAHTLNIDSLIIRVIFVIASMINGVGIIAYLALWLFMRPEEAAFESQEETMRHNVNEIRGRAVELGQEVQGAFRGKWRSSGRSASNLYMAIGVGAVGLGILALLKNLGWLGWMGHIMMPLALVALGAVLLLNNLRDK